MEPSNFILNYYHKLMEWDVTKFLIPDRRLTQEEVEKKLDECSVAYHERAKNFIGYQAETDIKHTKHMQKFMDIHLNNIGDPFTKGSFLLNTKEIEYAVIRYFAQLWGTKMRSIEIDADPHNIRLQDPDVYWGYVLSMGSSEGNIMAAWMGRDYIAGKELIVNAKKGKLQPKLCKIVSEVKGLPGIEKLLPTVFFTSTSAHYSILKSAVLVNVPTFGEYGNEHYAGAEIPGVKKADELFPLQVPVYHDLDGRVDVEKLVSYVEFFASRGHGIMVMLNYGTTFTGAFDELDTAITKLKQVFVKYGLDEVTRQVQKPGSDETFFDKRTGYWIHIDGAYGGSYMPYLSKYYKNKPDQVIDTVIDPSGNKVEYKSSQIPSLDMTKYPDIHSIVTSGHKFSGAPFPCGIFMTRHKYQLHPPSSSMYIGSMDSTLSGSRNAISPIIYWKYLSLNSDEKIMDNAIRCLKYVQEVEARFRKIIEKKNKEKGLNLHVTRAPFGLTLIFSRMREAIRNKYTLANQTLNDIKYNHLFIFTKSVNQPEIIEEFLKQVAEDYSFEEELDKIDVSKLTGMATICVDQEKKKQKKLRKYQLDQCTV